MSRQPITYQVIVTSIVVAVLALFLGFYLISYQKSPSKPPSVLYLENKIQRRNLDPSVSYSSYLDDKSTPIVVVGEVLAQFPHWNISQVVALSKSKNLSGFFQHNSPIFGPYYDDQRPMHNLPTIQGNTPYLSNITLQIDTINQVFHQKHPKIFYSLSTSLSAIDSTLEKQFDFSEMLKFNPSHSSVNIWFGMKGGITPCHYDGYHNMYIQLSGIKHFLLLPPETRTEIKMFPFLHPSYGQCQRNKSEILQSKSIRDQRIEVLLRPGEMLYIPPFWIHEVTTIQPSVSLNVWTDIKDSQALQAIFSISIPGFPEYKESPSSSSFSTAPFSLPIKLVHGAFDSLPNRLALGTAIVVELLRLSVDPTERLVIIKDLLSRYNPLIEAHLLPSYDSISLPEIFFEQLKNQLWSTEIIQERPSSRPETLELLPVVWSKWLSDSIYSEGLSGYYLRQCLSHLSTMDSRYKAISLSSVVEMIALRVGGSGNSGIFIQLLGRLFFLFQ